MYGTQAAIARRQIWTLFENDVKMYGTQAAQRLSQRDYTFENDVMV